MLNFEMIRHYVGTRLLFKTERIVVSIRLGELDRFF
ncbi:hypothetical protein I588_03464 [Enterococcus pallens ATCC BAA-351]|uniref:Uncharacterized protein n=1 Tax=Enterococcus pallens ATCC BAA-351 TaxID=1158607 RepID=R2RTM0_9ENTE|nr:hypothetical protein UAU_05119 [Enterococcus pallens ATCC BAA-351]EOU18471.1 hypothetical protein I588_03464 [Enterococcus pallens ATCC BAA-351]